MQLSLVLTLTMPMEVLHNQIQFLDGGHMEFGPTTIMWKIQNKVPLDATYIRKVDSCAFYYKGSGSGYCHLGHFNGRWHNLVGGYDGNSKYHIMYGKILVSSLLSRLLSYSDLYMK